MSRLTPSLPRHDLVPTALCDAGATAPGQWYVLHTRTHQEKRLAASLSEMGIEHYLPLLRTQSFRRSRKVEANMPLFPGYLFLRGSLDDAYRADRTHRVAQILTVCNQPQLEWEIRNLRLALEGGAPLDPYPYLANGTRVEVRAGPLQGLQGVVAQRRSNRLILQVEMLGQAACLEIDGSLLGPV